MFERIESGTLAAIGKVVVVTRLDPWFIKAKGELPSRVRLFAKSVPFKDLRSEIDSLIGSLALSP